MIEPNPNIGIGIDQIGYGNATGPILPPYVGQSSQQTKIVGQSSSRPYSPLNGSAQMGHHHHQFGGHFPESPSAHQNDQKMGGIAGIGSASNANLSATTCSPSQIQSPMDLFIDFTRPDASRMRPLLVDGKRLYVDEHYISVWSPVLRSWCIECPDRELILANLQYEHVLEMLLAIHPTYKDVDEQTVHLLLPLAFDYQMDGLLHRCECFLITNKLPFLEKVWLADRFQLNRLLALLLRELRPNSHKLDLSGPRYSGLSDRVKVLLLERMHGSPAPEELPEPPVDMEHLLALSDLNFSTVRAKTGRAYHVNPYYVAAWSTLFQERLCNGIGGQGGTDEELIYCPCSSEELKYFFMAIYPPQLRITESNIAPVLMAACKLESHGLLRKCASILLSPQTQLSVFVRLSLLDRCRLQELLDQCLQMVQKAEHILEMSQQQTYECLSVRAKSAMMDRFAQLIPLQGGPSYWLNSSNQPTPLSTSAGQFIHYCARCKSQSNCGEITWQCTQCKTYISPNQQHQNNNGIHHQQQQTQQTTSRQHSMAGQRQGSAQPHQGGGQNTANSAVANSQQQPQARLSSSHR